MFTSIYYEKKKNLIHLWDDEKGYLHFPFQKYEFLPNKNGEYTTIYGESAKKYFCRYLTEGSYEGDVRPEMRTLVDIYYDKSNIPNYKLAVLDIETTTEQGFPDIRNPLNPINGFTYYRKWENMYYCYILHDDHISRDFKRVKVRSVQTEAQLLIELINLVKNDRPDILTGWNVGHTLMGQDSFDIPYIYNRGLRVIGQRIHQLCPIKNVGIQERHNREFSYIIPGISVIDYMQLYKKYTYNEQSNYSLNHISKTELNQEKIKYTGSLDKLYREDIQTFIKYNINDVFLVNGLDDKLQFIDLVVTIASLCHIPYEDIWHQTRIIDGLLLTKLKNKKIVLPNKPAYSKKSQYAGAYVKSPQVGLHKNVYDLDFKSLYPSIMMSLNISPDTKLGKIVNWNTNDEKFLCSNDDGSGIMEIEKEKFFDYIKKNKITISSNGILYSNDKIGIIPKILSGLLESRTVAKNQMKKNKEAGKDFKKDQQEQLAYKYLANSVYGYIGAASTRLFDIDNAEAVTLTGQKLIQKTMEIGNLYYKFKNKMTEIILENGKIIRKYNHNIIKVKRNNKIIEINVSDIKETDELDDTMS